MSNPFTALIGPSGMQLPPIVGGGLSSGYTPLIMPTTTPGVSWADTSNATMALLTTTLPPDPYRSSKYSIFEMVFVGCVSSFLSLFTVLGNILVMVSFKIDKQLQTISNYFLFSLAVADFVIGLVSMPLYSIYTVMGYWPFGPSVCDTWLALDYLVSNASVLNLLIISFDRYFSVTRPLTYRARRTTRRAAMMISAAWGISLILWPPWIYSWPYLEGKRTVPDAECYIQFIETNHYITFGTAIAAFYVPVSIMLCLYWKIWQETEKRQRDLSQLQAGKKDSSRRSNSSDEAVDVEEWKRMRSESCICQDHLERVSTCPAHQRQSAFPKWCRRRLQCIWTLWILCTGFCRVDQDAEDYPEEVEDEHASPGGCGTPASIETPLQSSVSRCTSLNVIRDPLASTPTRKSDNVIVVSPSQTIQTTQVVQSEGSNGKLPGNDSVYTILIRIPGETDGKNASIRMIQEPGPLPPLPIHPKAKLVSSTPSDFASFKQSPAVHGSSPGRRPSAPVPPLGAKVVPKTVSGKGSIGTIGSTNTVTPLQPKRKKKKNQEKKQERKAAKTLSAILLTFIITWTPYNILVLLRTVLQDPNAIPKTLWDLSYYLCYINSTINPMCYALCNASFRRTYVRILTCKWDNSKRQAVNRGYYN